MIKYDYKIPNKSHLVVMFYIGAYLLLMGMMTPYMVPAWIIIMLIGYPVIYVIQYIVYFVTIENKFMMKVYEDIKLEVKEELESS